FSAAGFASWASAGDVPGIPKWPVAPTASTPRPITIPTRALSVMDVPPIISWFTASLDRCAGDARDELVEEEVVDDGHGYADQEPPRHQRPPEVDVAADQLGGNSQGHRLLIRDRHEGQRVEEILHRQREGEDHRGDEPG